MPEVIPNWHPYWVHFTIAFGLIGAAGWLLSLLSPRLGQLRDFAVNCWYLAALLSLPTGISGWLAYNSVTHDSAGHLAMIEHRNFALMTLGVIWAGALLNWLSRHRRPLWYWGIAALALVQIGLIAATGHKGSQLVFRHGLGVQSLPALQVHDHHGKEPHPHPLTEPALPEADGPQDDEDHHHSKAPHVQSSASPSQQSAPAPDNGSPPHDHDAHPHNN